MNNYEIEKLLSIYRTPFYVFDINVLKKRIEYLRKHLPNNILLCYAIKANTFILKEMSDWIDRFEVCSSGELNICNSLKLPPQKLVISGVSKDPDEMKNLIRENVPIGIYTIESMQQYEVLKSASTKFNVRINLILRLTSGNQFGLDKEEIRNIISNQKETSLINIRGIQYFSKTQKNSIKCIRREISHVLDFMNELSTDYNCKLDELEFGPGFPINYFMSDTFDEEGYLKEFSEILNTVNPNIKITLEIGRSIAASCGKYFTKIIDVKRNREENYAIVDGGIHHLVYYGQTMAMKIPKYSIYQKSRTSQNVIDTKLKWNICGSLCTVNDILVKQIPISNLQIEDVVIFENTGAYCATEGISLFLSRNLPQIILIDENYNSFLVRDSFETNILNKPVYIKEN